MGATGPRTGAVDFDFDNVSVSSSVTSYSDVGATSRGHGPDNRGLHGSRAREGGQYSRASRPPDHLRGCAAAVRE